jgi:hypothetical protein
MSLVQLLLVQLFQIMLSGHLCKSLLLLYLVL